MVFTLLVLAAFLAGVINSVAGGGSFLTFPALVFAGIPSVVANASSTVALLPGSAASGFAYRGEIRSSGQANLRSWLLISLAGGALGAFLLLFTSDRTFRHLAPWLLLMATIVFAFGSQLSRALQGRMQVSSRAMLILLLPIAVYGGYFGGGIGIMFLAAFRLYGMENIHGMNGIKAVLAATLNGIAALIFISARQVSWKPTLIMMAAGIVGGYLGPLLARRVPAATIRAMVVTVGVLMTIYFFRTVSG